MPVHLLCPVRRCGTPLERGRDAWRCPQGHAFDVARSGYCNLLQPQDRRSRRPGDAPEVVEARRRFLDAGHGEALLGELLREITDGMAVLDVGCGEGAYLGGIARLRTVEAHGVDLSTAAVDLAARRYPEATWIVANADRFLPYADGSFNRILSVDSRLNPPEMRRVLAPEGRLVVAVPAPDDLVELRQAVLGEGIQKDRFERASGLLSDLFELEERRRVARTVRLGPDAARDALAATYRGGRPSRRERIAAIPAMEVTLSHDLGRFRSKIPAS